MNQILKGQDRVIVILPEGTRVRTDADRQAILDSVTRLVYRDGEVPKGVPFDLPGITQRWTLDQDKNWILRIGEEDFSFRYVRRDIESVRMLEFLAAVFPNVVFPIAGEPLKVDPATLADNSPEVHTGSDEPLYGHYCDKCEFMGKWQGMGESGPATIFDLYFCAAGTTGGTIIARYGSDVGAYHSGIVFGKDRLIPALTEAYRRAVLRGSIVDSTIPTREEIKAYAEEIRQRRKDWSPAALEELGRELGSIK